MNKIEAKHKIEIFLNVCMALIAALFGTFMVTVGELYAAMLLWFIFMVFIVLIMRRYFGVRKDGSL